MAEYTLSNLADQDLLEIFQYSITEFGLVKAHEYKSKIIIGLERAASQPSIGRVHTSEKGERFRRIDIRRHAVFYRSTDSGIFVVRILHQMIDFDRHLEQ